MAVVLPVAEPAYCGVDELGCVDLEEVPLDIELVFLLDRFMPLADLLFEEEAPIIPLAFDIEPEPDDIDPEPDEPDADDPVELPDWAMAPVASASAAAQAIAVLVM